jgi:hypothetical protein
MNKIEPKIPGSTVTYNYLYDDMPLDWKEAELFFAILPNGNTIDVGWYPECDPNGAFKVTLRDSAQNRIDVMSTRDLNQMIFAIESLASQSARQTVKPSTVSVSYGWTVLPFTQNTNSVSTQYHSGTFRTQSTQVSA